jgi:alpha/beta superfamily hydrolase
MPEQALMLDSGDVRLEARYAPGQGRDAVVICHPHPEYGGSMDNNVVLAARDALAAQGYGTLRFNFRGVGQSGGRYSGGVGEAADVRYLMTDLAQRERATVHLAAYSFGAWVALQATAESAPPASLLLFSPPVDFMPFDELRLPDTTCLITLGDRDEFCALASLEGWLAKQPREHVQRIVLKGGDHFYRGQETALRQAIAEFVGADK